MDEIQTRFGGYEGFKRHFDAVMGRTVGSFVTIGYLLIVARDSGILKGSGYSGMGEFAEKEYGLRPDQTSRFIAVAERYGDANGNVLPQYRDHSFSLLTEMLTLPAGIAEEIPAETPREEVRALKEELREEEQTSDIELAIEKSETDEQNGEEDRLLRFFREWYRENPTAFSRAWEHGHNAELGQGTDYAELTISAIAPAGVALLMARVPGEGRFMLSINGKDQLPTLTSGRTGEKEAVAWTELIDGWLPLIYGTQSAQDRWHELYGDAEDLIEEPAKKAEKQEEKEKVIKISEKPKQKKEPSEKKEEPKPVLPEQPEVIEAEFEEIEADEKDENCAGATEIEITPEAAHREIPITGPETPELVDASALLEAIDVMAGMISSLEKFDQYTIRSSWIPQIENVLRVLKRFKEIAGIEGQFTMPEPIEVNGVMTEPGL
ncbi:MAG: hypothetical protein J6M46_03280 [Lachnospiraceae bacterium]|nr:hypothetical protein [Lachnospiraceae bacterium]